MTLIEQIETLLKPPLEKLGIQLYELTLAFESGTHYLRVFIDKPGGKVDLDLLTQVSQLISPLLDQADFIKHQYTLDVASAGAERELKLSDLEHYLNSWIQVATERPVQGENRLRGKLVALSEEAFELDVPIKTRIKRYRIEKNNVRKINKAIH